MTSRTLRTSSTRRTSRTLRTVRSRLLLATGVTALVAGLGAGVVGSAGAAPAERVRTPAPDTIVEVLGDKANGFEIRYFDGSALYPPTDSESRAECNEYDTTVARVRCRTEVRVWYRELGNIKQALEWAHEQHA